MNAYKRHRFPPEVISNPWPASTVTLAAFIEFPKNSPGRIYEELLLERGLYPGVETPAMPDDVDAGDASAVVEMTIANLLILLEN
jgi:hypothetical protein